MLNIHKPLLALGLTVEFPHVLNNSLRQTFISCPRKCFYDNILGLKSIKSYGISIHLNFGGAVAEGMDMMRQTFYGPGGGDADTALIAGLQAALKKFNTEFYEETHVKNVVSLCALLIDNTERWPLGEDYLVPLIDENGKPSSEFSFCTPLHPGLIHPGTGQPLLYAGRLDWLAQHAGAVIPKGHKPMLSLVDEKTSGSLGASWSKQWTMESQFSSYAWVCRKMGMNVGNVVIRGMAPYKTKPTGTEELTLRRPDYQVQEWYDTWCMEVRQMLTYFEAGVWPKNLGKACSSFGSCRFMELCTVQDPSAWIAAGYRQVWWDPITGTEKNSPEGVGK